MQNNFGPIIDVNIVNSKSSCPGGTKSLLIIPEQVIRGCCNDWLVDWVIDWLINWIIDSLTDCLNDCLIDWLFDCFIEAILLSMNVSKIPLQSFSPVLENLFSPSFSLWRKGSFFDFWRSFSRFLRLSPPFDLPRNLLSYMPTEEHLLNFYKKLINISGT